MLRTFPKVIAWHNIILFLPGHMKLKIKSAFTSEMKFNHCKSLEFLFYKAVIFHIIFRHNLLTVAKVSLHS